MTTKLLILTNEESMEELESEFEDVDVASLADALITANSSSEIMIEGRDIEEYDAVYLDPSNKAFSYIRVLLDVLQEKDIPSNLNYSSHFIVAKKPYLYNALSEKGVDIRDTVCVSTHKGLTEIEKDIEAPALAKRYEGVELKDTTVLEDLEEAHDFMENVEHGKHFVTLQEYEEDELYDILYIDGELISLKLESEPWETEGEPKRSYHNVTQEQKEVARGAAEALGADVCRIVLSGEKVIDMYSDHDLEMFQEISGKNILGKMASYLRGDGD